MLKKFLILLLVSTYSVCFNWLWAGSIASSDALSTHNQVRSLANQGQYAGQPTPSPLLNELSWDDSLAQSAQQYANQCVWEHSRNRINTGENLYVQGSSSATNETSIAQAVESWAAEYAFYNFSNASCQSGEMCGHYTQIVWQDSLLVGCALSKCNPMLASDGSTLFSSDFPFSNFIVCHYGPSGNLSGLPPYDIDGGDSSLTASYDLSTETLELPYVLLHFPDNLVAGYNATFTLTKTNPYTFALQDAFQVDYLGKRHGDSYDTHSGQLYMPNLQLKNNGSTLSNSAVVLQFNSSSGGYELKSFK